MLQTLRAWLNGSRDYYTGVAIYSQLSPDENLLNVLKKGPNDFRIKRLQEELLEAWNRLNKVENGNIFKPSLGERSSLLAGSDSGDRLHKEKQNTGKLQNELVFQLPPKGRRPNSDLYAACKLEADHKYKEVMNTRAVLFKIASIEGFEDPNTSAKINDRVKLALDVVQGYQHLSQLYDRAEYVKLHGRLPDGGEELNEPEYDHLPDHLVKLRLDNARKAYNKLKKKESTPERVALLQKHEENIAKLEKQWLSLKP